MGAFAFVMTLALALARELVVEGARPRVVESVLVCERGEGLWLEYGVAETADDWP